MSSKSPLQGISESNLIDMMILRSYTLDVSVQVTFHSSALPDVIQAKVAAGIAAHRLPAGLLYGSIGQAARWLKYARAWAPIHRRDAISALYQSVYRSTLDSMERDEFHYLALGCGDGVKDASFLELTASDKWRVKVTLLDVSPSLTLGAAQRLNAWQTQLHVADLESQPDLSVLDLAERRQPRVISCLGMLPTLGHAMLFPYLSSVLKPEDRLVISANLSPTVSDEDKASIKSQYDNPEARLWYSGALLELGLERNDFALRCSVESLSGTAGAYRIVVHAEILRGFELQLHGEIYPMAAGDRLEVFRSERWTPSALRHRFSHQGLEIIQASVSNDCQEGVYVIANRNQFPG